MEADTTRRRFGGERGETLLESIVAMGILFAVAIAAYAGFHAVFEVSSGQRASARGETVLRSAAEQLQSPDLAYLPRAGCMGGAAYAIPALTTTEPGYHISVASVDFWTGASTVPSADVGSSFVATCPTTDAADPGLQRISLSVSKPDGRTDVLTVLKRRA